MARLNYNHLRYFWAVALDGNLTRVAAAMNVSQSALSVQIRQLEESLGQKLFDRVGRSLVLTDAGRIALDHADEIFRVGRELTDALGGAGGSRQMLRIGSAATLSRNFQIGFLRPMLRRRDVEVVVRSGGIAELIETMERGRLDLILANVAPLAAGEARWRVHKLAEQPVTLVGAPELVAAGQSLEETLASTPLVLPTRDNHLRTDFDRLAARLGVEPQIAAEVDDMALMRLLASEGVGLAVVPPIVVEAELNDGRLIALTTLAEMTETFFAIEPERRFKNPLVEELLTHEDGAAGRQAHTAGGIDL